MRELARGIAIGADELARRPARASDPAALNEALRALSRTTARTPQEALAALVEAARKLTGASSAGLALADGAGADAAHWRAAAGPLAQLSGTALAPAALAGLEPRAVEALRAPFGDGNAPDGELWLVAHEGDPALDAEDQRTLEALADFAALACETLSLHGARGDSERRFEGFMQHLPGLAWIKDLAGRYVFANEAAARAFQRPLSVLYGRTDDEVFPPETAAQFRANDRASIELNAAVAAIETLEHEDGVLHHSLVHKFPIPGSDGAPRLIGGVAIDITERMRAEQVLRESEERFREMADSVPAIIYTTQSDGYCTFLSPAWSAFTGRPNELGLGFGWAQSVHPDDLETVRSVFAQGAQAFRVEFRLRGPAGDDRWVIGSGAPRFAAGGEHLGFVGSVLDISEEKRAESELRHSVQIYRAIGDSIDYGVWICDPEGRNVYASQSFLALVGLTQEQCAGYGWATALHPDDAEQTIAQWQECVRGGREWYVELRFRGADGRDHPVLARGVPVRSERGEVTAWAGIHLDISRLKQVEEELRELDRKKDEFLATLAHELRNPLAPIRNSLLVLRSGGTPGESERMHDMIDRQVSHLIRLVDDLLEVSRITSGKVELRRERIELAEVVRAALESSMPAIDAAGHRIDLSLASEPLVLEADPVRLTQVLANLLNNAAKYTEEGGAIQLSTGRGGDSAVVSVRDNGLGIPPAMLPRVFDLFAQVGHTLGRAQGGLGIGLALVKRLVEMHGGRVEARSEGWGTGSEFVVTLPLAAPASGVSAGSPAWPRTPTGLAARRRFLVVDDNRDAADSLALLLEVYGAEVRVAYDGTSALAELREARPDVVLLDLGMPDMDGFEVAARIRKQPELAGVVLVALTGWGQPEDRRATRAAGFDLHLVKPISPPELRDLIALRRP
ncbi:MAG TPA: PAS domain S-box protein [Myxococcota bacterium]|nr:PAS domain S-box protein [Myxococcota bacterium]